MVNKRESLCDLSQSFSDAGKWFTNKSSFLCFLHVKHYRGSPRLQNYWYHILHLHCDSKIIFNFQHCHLCRVLYILELACAGQVVEGATSLARNFVSRGTHLQWTNIEDMDSFILWATHRISAKPLCVNLPTASYHMVVRPAEYLDSRRTKGFVQIKVDLQYEHESFIPELLTGLRPRHSECGQLAWSRWLQNCWNDFQIWAL